MMEDTGALNLRWASLMIEELVRGGVRICALGAGSRSAPLAVAAARHPGLRCVVHVDERAAAFYALGAARAEGVPAVWITTSGTAVANGMPAAVEADRAGVPLLLITADRPPELRDTGANQTIDQVRGFAGFVRWQCDLPCPTAAIPEAYVLTTVDQALHRARGPAGGPVHLNCMFREPLLPDPGAVPRPEATDLAAWRGGGRPYTTYAAPAPGEMPAALDAVLGAARRGLVIAGELRTPADRRAAVAVSERLQWPLLPDVLSGLRLGGGGACSAVHHDLLLLDTTRHASLRPDTVLHIGGAITSQRLQAFLRDSAPARYVRIQPSPARHDPTHQVTLAVQAAVEAVAAWTKGTPADGNADWLQAWRTPDATIATAIETALADERRIQEPAVARIVSCLLPRGRALFLGNSMPIRDMNLFGAADGSAPAVFAHRGASGIDGNLAGAAGLAAGLGAPLTAVVGDLACLHDLNALLLLARSPHPVTLVVVNNDGGGIFSFLPVARHPDVFEAHFGTPHGLRFAAAAALFGLEHVLVETPDALVTACRTSATASKSMVIEVITDRAENVRVHAALQARVQEALRA